MELLRFGFIVFIAAVEHLAHETVVSFNTTRDFVRYRLRWVVRDSVVDKLRRIRSGLR
jgi:hypothetical protein